MTDVPKICVYSTGNEDLPLFSFPSRSTSPTIQGKLSTIPFEFSDHTRPGSFISINTPNTRFSSMSGTIEPLLKVNNDSLNILPEKLQKLKENFQLRPRKNALEIPDLSQNNEIDCGIPTLKWCAYCKKETATEVFYVKSGKTFWASVAIFLSGGVFGCFLLPYALDQCKDLRMRCHRCKRIVDGGIE